MTDADDPEILREACPGTVDGCRATAVLEDLKTALRPVWQSGSVVEAARAAIAENDILREAMRRMADHLAAVNELFGSQTEMVFDGLNSEDIFGDYAVARALTTADHSVIAPAEERLAADERLASIRAAVEERRAKEKG